jgi:hypothetical protein
MTGFSGLVTSFIFSYQGARFQDDVLSFIYFFEYIFDCRLKNETELSLRPKKSIVVSGESKISHIDPAGSSLLNLPSTETEKP